MRLLLFPIRSQPGVVYKSVTYKKGCNVVVTPLITGATFPKNAVNGAGFRKNI